MYGERLLRGVQHALDREDHRLRAMAGRLEALSPLAVLARGYSITFSLPQHRVLTDAESVQPGASLETRLARGRILSAVTQILKE